MLGCIWKVLQFNELKALRISLPEACAIYVCLFIIRSVCFKLTCLTRPQIEGRIRLLSPCAKRGCKQLIFDQWPTTTDAPSWRHNVNIIKMPKKRWKIKNAPHVERERATKNQWNNLNSSENDMHRQQQQQQQHEKMQLNKKNKNKNKNSNKKWESKEK